MIDRFPTYDTETIDKLFLELSQFTKARTAGEIQLNMLLMSVQSKYPGESRFETALRYIKQAESHSEASACATVVNLKNTSDK